MRRDRDINNNIHREKPCRTCGGHRFVSYINDRGLPWLRCYPCGIKKSREYKENPGAYFQKKIERSLSAQMHRADPRLSKIRNSAKKRGLEFNLAEYPPIPSHCPILGIPILMRGHRDFRPSVDRVDNTKGYIPGNVRVVSARANRMKSDITQGTAAAIAAYMYNHKK